MNKYAKINIEQLNTAFRGLLLGGSYERFQVRCNGRGGEGCSRRVCRGAEQGTRQERSSSSVHELHDQGRHQGHVRRRSQGLQGRRVRLCSQAGDQGDS